MNAQEIAALSALLVKFSNFIASTPITEQGSLYGKKMDAALATDLNTALSYWKGRVPAETPRKLSFRRERDDVGGGYGRSDY